MNQLNYFLQFVFWVGAVGLTTPLLLYPVALYLLAGWRTPKQSSAKAVSLQADPLPKSVPHSASDDASLPNVTLVISAFNEAGFIAEKLANALAVDYPADKWKVVVISDASNDGTDEIVSQITDRRVELFRLPERIGKSAGLTKYCAQADTNILLFTDANSMFRADAVRRLIRHFKDPKVGFVAGRQVYQTADEASAKSENTYWNFELQLKAWESRLSSVVGADGAIYALRRELFEPLEAEDINDFLLPLKVVVKGYRGVFEPEAICVEEAAPDFMGEFRRKYRIVNRSLRAVRKVPQALNPFHVGWFAVQLFAHKVLRWLAPLFLMLMLATSLLLAASGSQLFLGLLVLQLLGYGCAMLYRIPPLRSVRIVYLAHYFLLVNIAAAFGLALHLSGRTIGTWQPQRWVS